MIAPTARWILMRRTDAQSAAVPIKISYFNGRVVLHGSAAPATLAGAALSLSKYRPRVRHCGGASGIMGKRRGQGSPCLRFPLRPDPASPVPTGFLARVLLPQISKKPDLFNRLPGRPFGTARSCPGRRAKTIVRPSSGRARRGGGRGACPPDFFTPCSTRRHSRRSPGTCCGRIRCRSCRSSPSPRP